MKTRSFHYIFISKVSYSSENLKTRIKITDLHIHDDIVFSLAANQLKITHTHTQMQFFISSWTTALSERCSSQAVGCFKLSQTFSLQVYIIMDINNWLQINRIAHHRVHKVSALSDWSTGLSYFSWVDDTVWPLRNEQWGKGRWSKRCDAMYYYRVHYVLNRYQINSNHSKPLQLNCSRPLLDFRRKKYHHYVIRWIPECNSFLIPI